MVLNECVSFALTFTGLNLFLKVIALKGASDTRF